MATMQLVRKTYSYKKKAVHKTEHYTFPTAYLYNKLVSTSMSCAYLARRVLIKLVNTSLLRTYLARCALIKLGALIKLVARLLS